MHTSAGVHSTDSDGVLPVTGGFASSEEPGCSDQPKRGRTQHARPAEGLERSVIHNEWVKGDYSFVVGLLVVVILVCPPFLFFFVCSLSELCSPMIFFLAGLKDVPEGAVCMSASQVLAFGQAAVRLERTQSRVEDRSLSRR